MADSSYTYIASTGVIVADTSDVLDTVTAEFQTAFGVDMPMDPETPQGLLVTAETAARTGVAENNAALANQINPREAGGIYLEAICALMGLYKDGATFTRSPGCIVTGQPGAPTFPAGIQMKTAAGDIFASAGTVDLDSSGNGTVDFIAIESGPVPCPADGQCQIIDVVLGWETVSTPNDPVLGALEQSDASLRAEREETLAKQGISSVEAQMSDLADLLGVISIQYRENYTKVPATIDGITLDANSVWACVDGGTDLDVATSLLQNKSDGAAWNGAVSVPVLNAVSGQTYTVLFDRPALVPIMARFTIRQGTFSGDITALVKQAMADYQAQLIPPLSGFKVGTQASPFEMGGAVMLENPGMFVAKVEIALVSSGVYQTTELPIVINQKAQLNQSAILVVIE